MFAWNHQVHYIFHKLTIPLVVPFTATFWPSGKLGILYYNTNMFSREVTSYKQYYTSCPGFMGVVHQTIPYFGFLYHVEVIYLCFGGAYCICLIPVLIVTRI